VYIAPLKALVRERLKDWTTLMGPRLGKTVVELTGDFTPGTHAVRVRRRSDGGVCGCGQTSGHSRRRTS
jgi:hypothetical protein